MLPKVTKPASIRSLGMVDAGRLTDLAAQLSDSAWDKVDAVKENTYAVFHHTQHLIFRFINGNRDPEVYYDTEAWALWAPILEPVMRQAVIPYGFHNPVFPKAMLAKLKAGHDIDLHSDGAGSNVRCHKIHVPLITNPGAVFCLERDEFHLAAGEAFEVNNLKQHGGRNRGSTDRIHFIFEVYEQLAS